MEKITPIPSFAVKIIALIPSNPDFTNSRFLLPCIPSSRAPRMVNDPTQNKMKAVVRPSAKALSFVATRFLKRSAKSRSSVSTRRRCPVIPPNIRDRINTSKKDSGNLKAI